MRNGPSHPLCLALTALLLLNDILLKGVGPAWLTGKLSDVAWLGVAPVVLAAVLVRLRLSERRAGGISLAGTAAVFCLLQLWPGFGDGVAELLGGHNVADPTDLLALPALWLATRCWRPVRPRPWALPLAGFACLATSSWDPPVYEERMPCDTETQWDPSAPLTILWSEGVPDLGNPNLHSGIRLRDAEGVEVPLHKEMKGLRLWLCPEGGLRPDTDYTWVVSFDDPHPNHELAPRLNLEGTWSFHTAASTVLPPLTEKRCRGFSDYDAFEHLECPYVDPGSMGATDDSGSTGDTGSLGQTGDTGLTY